MFLLFHDIGVPAEPFYLIGFIGLIVAPILSALGVYRIFSGQIGENEMRKSLITIGIFILISGLVYGFFCYLFEATPEVEHFPYFATVPFGLALSGIIWLKTESSIPAVFVGVILNLTSKICWFSLLENRKNRKNISR